MSRETRVEQYAEFLWNTLHGAKFVLAENGRDLIRQDQTVDKEYIEVDFMDEGYGVSSLDELIRLMKSNDFEYPFIGCSADLTMIS